jgi:hypothetical protein
VILPRFSKATVAFLPPALLLLPGVEATFGATMTRKALVEPVVLLLCGWALSRALVVRRKLLYPPAAVAAATLLLLFWMVPRSIDLTQSHAGIDALYVMSLFAVGYLLTAHLPLLSGVARVVYALHFASMIVALGLVYASQSTLLCSAYTLAIQRAFGWTLVPVGLGLYLLVLTCLTGWLGPAETPAGPNVSSAARSRH